MNRLTLCLCLALFGLLPVAKAQQTPPSDDGRLRTLPGSSDDDETPAARHRVNQIEELLLKGDFDRLDRIADKARTGKTRNPGGGWRLKAFYTELNASKGSEQSFQQRLQQLEAWIKAKPESITARVGLAEFYTNYAWFARGSATEDKVPDSAWPVFRERAKKAEEVLKQAAKLDQKCPESYAAMQTVALALDWDKGRAKKLFEQAVQFEPDYEYYYEHYANYLLPKWDGDEHDSLAFAQHAADTLGGERGDMMYFYIATVMIKRGNAGFKPEMDWPRIQRGQAAIEAAYGPSAGEQNRFAFMAVRFKDAATAQKEFTAIGEKWSPGVWRTRGYFEKARDWAAGKPQS